MWEGLTGGEVPICWICCQGGLDWGLNVEGHDRLQSVMVICGVQWRGCFPSHANIFKGEICWGEQIVKGILEHEDHVMGEGMEEDGACFRGSDGWFP